MSYNRNISDALRYLHRWSKHASLELTTLAIPNKPAQTNLLIQPVDHSGSSVPRFPVSPPQLHLFQRGWAEILPTTMLPGIR